MALVLADRVQETTTTTGTGTVTLAGAVTGYQTFAAIGNGNSTFYCIADQGGANWEVGIGTYTSSGTTLSRTTVLASSNSGSLVNFGSGTKSVFVTYPSEKSVNLDASGNVSSLGTIASAVWNGTTIGVAYGGTGVTTSSGANSVVLRDSNQNVSANNFLSGYNAVTAAGGTTVLTAASAYYQRLSGSTTQTFQLPDATTCVLGQAFVFDNDSSGTLTVVDNASGAVDTIPSGGYGYIFAESISTSAGSWGKYALVPGSYDFNTTTANFGGATITNAVWNGTTIASGYGGTGLTTFTAANYALYSTSASALTAGTLPTAAGGTGLTSFTSGGAVYATSTSALTTGTLPVTAGGTGLTTLTANYIPYGNGTSAFQSSSALNYTSTSLNAPQHVATNGLMVNNQTVGTSYSIPSGYSATSAGPVTVASGVTVTVPSGSRWVVL